MLTLVTHATLLRMGPIETNPGRAEMYPNTTANKGLVALASGACSQVCGLSLFQGLLCPVWFQQHASQLTHKPG